MALNNGSDNVGIGQSALDANTSGTSNVAVGRDALGGNTSASNNTAVGYQAGYSNTTGLGSTYLGYQAGYSATNFGNNTFVGYQAGYGATTNSASNCFVGYGSGSAVTTGSKNTIIGAYNGNQSSLDIRTASNYIVLSDGDGNPRGICTSGGNWLYGAVAFPSASVAGVGITGTSSGNASSSGASTSAYNHWLFYNGNGIVGNINTSGSTTAYVTSSDYRLKENIQPMTGALAKVVTLKPVTYTWKADGSAGEGFIAHELAEVCPDAVTGEKDAVDAEGNPQYQGIDVSFLVGTLTAAIQEQQAIIESLKARLDAANL
jgi:hypothetical protein